jgi:hypothetical protein
MKVNVTLVGWPKRKVKIMVKRNFSLAQDVFTKEGK